MHTRKLLNGRRTVGVLVAVAVVGAVAVGIWLTDDRGDRAVDTVPGEIAAGTASTSTTSGRAAAAASPAESSSPPRRGQPATLTAEPSERSAHSSSPAVAEPPAIGGSLMWLAGPGYEIDHLVVADGDGSNARTIADGSPVAAVWSPDGTRIAFLRAAATSGDGPVRSYALFVVDADGSGLHQISTTAVDHGGSSPSSLAWSPDGTTISYVQGFTAIGGCQSDLWAVDVVSGRPRQLTEGSCDYSPTWSPDSRRIAFFRTAAGRGTSLWAIDADGSDAGQLSPAREGVGTWPPTASWSPDGTLIAYDHGPEVFVIGADGSNPHALTTPRPDQSHTFPAWSPDGRQLALLEWSETDHSILVVGRDGAIRRRLATDRTREHSLSWSPDGRHLVAERQYEYGLVEMHVFPVSGSPSVPLGAVGQLPMFAPA